MPEVTISLEGHAEELAVFGSRDQHLRQVRDALGVKVLARHGEVRVEGEGDRVEMARQIFESLRALHRCRRTILSSDVAELIEKTLNPEDTQCRRGGRDSRGQPGGSASFGRPGPVLEGAS